ncbi:MAG: hypothetical protein ACO3I0_10685 [Limisphaerales bacterium]
MNPIRERTLQVLGLAPIGLLAWFYLYVIRQRSLLGYWPRPYHPDPKDAGFVLHHLTLTLGMTLIPGVTLATMVLILHRRSVDPGFRWVSALTLSLGAFVMFWAVVWRDPGQYIEWFWD